ncbi:MAG: flavodoxin family protein, partial [Clostridiales bacterium]|nr:flavodoxin family protein [Clostridiales bacterium]
DKNLILLGTLGAPVDGEHAGKVRERIAKLASENNRLILHYLCRGSIDLYRTENKRKIPEGQKGRIDEKGYLRHLDSQGHPNADELNGAKRAVTEALLKL